MEIIQGWMEQILSSEGKDILIKYVAQAIPTFSMSCFKLPRGLCKYIDSVLRGSWWAVKMENGNQFGYLGTCLPC
jgi:hypothetical protein